MKRTILILMIFSIIALNSTVAAFEMDNSTIPGLNVTEDIAGAFNESQVQNKTVAIIYDQESCVYCDILKDDVLSNATIQKEMNDKYITLLVDINKNPEFAASHKVLGTPTVEFIDSAGKEINRIDGYVDSEEFLKEI